MNQGIHKLSMRDYLADPCEQPSLTAGLADTIIRQSALHAKWQHPKLSPAYRQEENEKFDIGTTAHSLVLESDSSKVCVINPEDYPGAKGGVPDGWTNKAIRAARDTARASGLTPILAKHYNAVKEMVGVAREFISTCEFARELSDAEAELTCVAQDGRIWLRARPDLTSRDRRILINYKTCENAAPDGFCRRLPSLGYDLSAVFYERVMKNLGYRAEEFFIAQEITPPYACSLIGLDSATREIANGKLDLALAIWDKCMKTGRWGAYSGRVHYAIPSSYDMADAEERRLTADERIELATQA